MDDFGNPGRPNYYGLKPSEANFVKPYKKPLSSMSPVMAFADGKLRLVVGASGGPKIITSVLQVFTNYCLRGMPLFESVSNPRIHDQLMYHQKAVTTVEKCPLDQGPWITVSNTTKRALERRGHRLLDIDYAGTVQAVGVDFETSTFSAVSDIRKGGVPAGY